MKRKEIILLVFFIIFFIAVIDVPFGMIAKPPMWFYFVAPPVAFLICGLFNILLDIIIRWAKK
ncbi:MAG: hypothetical protein PHI12_13795 [Dehalococcoidales bacterium]|nr:hypothetical protein [Dehalococcoidales bacterium]